MYKGPQPIAEMSFYAGSFYNYDGEYTVVLIESLFWIIKIGLPVIKLFHFYCFRFHEIFVKFSYGAFGSRGVILVLFTIVNKLVNKRKLQYIVNTIVCMALKFCEGVPECCPKQII